MRERLVSWWASPEKRRGRTRCERRRRRHPRSRGADPVSDGEAGRMPNASSPAFLASASTRPTTSSLTQPWGMTATRYVHEFPAQAETIYALANGYLGLRETSRKGRRSRDRVSSLNGFYETWPIVYGEAAHGFAKTGQTIVNATDGKIIRLYVDDEPPEIHKASPARVLRTPRLAHGHRRSRIVWETPPASALPFLAAHGLDDAPSSGAADLRRALPEPYRGHHPSSEMMTSPPRRRGRAAGSSADWRASTDACSTLSPGAPATGACSCATVPGAAGSRWLAASTISSSPADAVANQSTAAKIGLRWFFPSTSTRNSRST